MAFNSYAFLLLYLPGVVALYWLAARWWGRVARLAVLVAATLGFYALAAPRAVPLLLASIAVNLALARCIASAGEPVRGRWLTAGVAANVALLVGIKYGAFLATNLAAASGGGGSFAALALPLGISFWTFQQIAFLVDVARARVTPDQPLTYAASVLFFPTIVAGPITYYREFAPQADGTPARGALPGHLLAGTMLIAAGLFKKTVIADSFALWVDPLFASAAAGHAPGPALSWALALGFLLQMYFDFSGYSDMALGCARLFGIRLPLNFFSPLRVTSIVDWWRRWHMSLGRFVGDHIFQPLALPLTRRAAGAGAGRWGITVAGVFAPSFVAMFVIGAWHGGSWTFIVFGLLHASYMVTAEAWRFARRRRNAPPRWWGAALGNAATILAVLVALVPFRAADMATATRLWGAMLGRGGHDPATWPILPGLGGAAFAAAIFAGMGWCYLLPNTAQLLDRLAPALAFESWHNVSPPRVRLAWRPTLAWGAGAGTALFFGLALVSRGTGAFVYFGY